MLLYFLDIHGLYHIKDLASINNYCMIFSYVFLSLFLIYSMPDRIGKKYFLLLVFFFLTFILESNFSNNPTIHNSTAFSINYFVLLFLCVTYFYKIFNNPSDLNLMREPVFWIVIGVLSNCMICLPMNIFLVFFKNIPKTMILKNILNSIFPFGYTLMYLCFVKSFLCSKNQ